MIEAAPRAAGRLPLTPPTPDYRGLLETCTEACVQTRYVDAKSGRLVWGVVHDPMVHASVCTSCMRLDPSNAYVTRSGPLTVDFRAQVVLVDGRPVALTQREWQLIEVLAREPGALIEYQTLVTYIWGPEIWESEVRRRHSPRKNTSGMSRITAVNLKRLRGKLGPAAGLIETVSHRGVRLRVLPPEGEA